jgi:Uma2 family endonuclease
VDRDLYNRLDEAIGEGQHVHLAYDGKDLELMTTGNIHELFKVRIGTFVSAVTAGLDIDYLSAGQTTWKTEQADRGLEADQSYYFDAEKLRVARAALARRSMDPADYPHPDLAIEIDISRSQVDRPSIYKALRVAEVWRFDGIKLVIEQLQPDGSYAEAEVSRFLPIRPEEIVGWLTADDALLEAAWNRRLYQWAMGLGRQA